MSKGNFWNGINGGKLIEELDDGNYLQYLKQNAKAPVMYYAPWCGYSQAARQGYAGAAKQLKGKIVLTAVDCDEAPDALSSTPNRPIKTYPTFYFFQDGQFVENYTGEKTIDELVAWITSHL